MRMKRVVVALALLAAAVLTRPMKVSTAVDPAQVGQWSGVLPWSAIPVHSHLLNTGRVLTWQQGSQATIWDPATRSFAGVPDPWADLLCAGHTFLADGRLITVATSEVASRTQTLDLSTSTWTIVDNRLIDGGSAVMFQPGKFMKAGTAADSGNAGLAAPTAFVLDMTQPAPAWQPTGSMAFPRSFHNLTMLPDGTTLVTGGGTDRSAFNTANAILAAEVWSPASGAWTTLASMVTPRLYHSTALLLPDARVLVAGGGSDTGVADQPTAEIFSPPYLFKGPRPTIAAVGSTLAYGTPFTVATPDNASIPSVTLIPTGSVTHAFNQNQAFQTLAFEATPDGLSVTAPANANLAPPGYYMLFIVNSIGVPSVAAFVNLPASGTPPPTASAPNVVNATQAVATTTITNAGLTVGPVTTAASATVPAGSVISQTPIAGAQAATGSAVALVVSSGPGVVTVPAATTVSLAGTGAVVSTPT